MSGQVGSLLFHDQQQRTFSPLVVTQADDGSVDDRRMADSNVFQLDRADLFAPRFDHILGTIRDLEITVLIERTHVTRRQPSIAGRDNTGAGPKDLEPEHHPMLSRHAVIPCLRYPPL